MIIFALCLICATLCIMLIVFACWVNHLEKKLDYLQQELEELKGVR